MLCGNAVTMALNDRRLRIHKETCSREYTEQKAADNKLRGRSTSVEVRRGAQVATCKLLLHRVSNLWDIFRIRPTKNSFQYRAVGDVVINGPVFLRLGA